MRDGPKTLQHDSAGLETCFVVSVWERTHEPCLTRLAAGSVPSFPGRPSRSCRNTSWPSWGAGASGPSVGAGQLLWASSSPSEGPSLHDLSGHAPPGKPVGSYSPVSKPCLSGVFSIKKVLPFKDECIDTEATGGCFPLPFGRLLEDGAGHPLLGVPWHLIGRAWFSQHMLRIVSWVSPRHKTSFWHISVVPEASLFTTSK